MRQRRKNGEEIYDLKAVCKQRDPWPQPWIRVKGQRQLGSQLADKVCVSYKRPRTPVSYSLGGSLGGSWRGERE